MRDRETGKEVFLGDVDFFPRFAIKKGMLNGTPFELKDFSRFFHDFFRESMKMQVLSTPIKSTLFELKIKWRWQRGSNPRPAL